MAPLTEGEWGRPTTLLLDDLGGTFSMFERRISLPGGRKLIKMGLGERVSVLLVGSEKNYPGGLEAELIFGDDDDESTGLYLSYNSRGKLRLVDISLATLLRMSEIRELVEVARMFDVLNNDFLITLKPLDNQLIMDRQDEKGDFFPVAGREIRSQQMTSFCLGMSDGWELYIQIGLSDDRAFFLFEEIGGSQPPYIPWEMQLSLQTDIKEFDYIRNPKGVDDFLFNDLLSFTWWGDH